MGIFFRAAFFLLLAALFSEPTIAKSSSIPAPSPSASLVPSAKATYFCSRIRRSRNRDPIHSAEATIRVELDNRSDFEQIYTKLPATARLFHLKYFSPVGTQLGKRTKLFTNGKFWIEEGTQRKGQSYKSERVVDSEIKEVRFSVSNTIQDPSYIRLGADRYFFMLCRGESAIHSNR